MEFSTIIILCFCLISFVSVALSTYTLKKVIELEKEKKHTDYECYHCGTDVFNLLEPKCKKCGASYTPYSDTHIIRKV